LKYYLLLLLLLVASCLIGSDQHLCGFPKPNGDLTMKSWLNHKKKDDLTPYGVFSPAC